MSANEQDITLKQPLLPRNTITINEKIESLLGKVTVKKIKAQLSSDFLASLDLHAIPPEKLRKHSNEIGHFVYFFEVNQNNEHKWM